MSSEITITFEQWQQLMDTMREETGKKNLKSMDVAVQIGAEVAVERAAKEFQEVQAKKNKEQSLNALVTELEASTVEGITRLASKPFDNPECVQFLDSVDKNKFLAGVHSEVQKLVKGLFDGLLPPKPKAAKIKKRASTKVGGRKTKSPVYIDGNESNWTAIFGLLKGLEPASARSKRNVTNSLKAEYDIDPVTIDDAELSRILSKETGKLITVGKVNGSQAEATHTESKPEGDELPF